jgi:phosphohistidine phosphatase SixA
VNLHLIPAAAGLQFITILATCALTPSAAVAAPAHTMGRMASMGAAPAPAADSRGCFFAIEFALADAQSRGQTPVSLDCAQSEQQMGQALQAGGYVILFQHGPSDQDQADTDPTNLANCATQRNLTDAGRDQARAIGAAFRRLSIPVGAVLSSEYCRALEYSRLAFNTAVPEAGLDLNDPLGDEKGHHNVVLLDLVWTPPDAGANTVLVTHPSNIRDGLGAGLPTDGEAVIFRVAAPGSSIAVAQVMPTDWSQLADALAPE